MCGRAVVDVENVLVVVGDDERVMLLRGNGDEINDNELIDLIQVRRWSR
jgi:protein required for attachment to host cells